MTGEVEPVPSIEESFLVALGYADFVHQIVPGADVTGRHFLDAYRDPSNRQHTEDMMRGFLAMPPSDPDYEATKKHLKTYVEAYFGED